MRRDLLHSVKSGILSAVLSGAFFLLGGSARGVIASPASPPGPSSPGDAGARSQGLRAAASAQEEDEGQAETPAPAAPAKKKPTKKGEKKPAPVDPPEEDGENASAKKVEKDDGDGETGVPPAASKKSTKKLSIDEEYVKSNVEKYLNPTKIEWLPDGRVKLLFDFGPKKDEHSDIFTPKISKEVNNIFRWSLPREYASWWGRSTSTSEDGTYYYGALRISQEGTAHLNAWFTDDIEAEMWFANGSSTSQKQTVALVFTNGMKSLGSNWGTQAATFQSGRQRTAKGAIENAGMDTNVKIKLIVRNGTFESHRDGRLRQSDKYAPKSFSSGKIGFVWGGGLAGFVYKLEITGRLDAKKMAETLRKTARK